MNSLTVSLMQLLLYIRGFSNTWVIASVLYSSYCLEYTVSHVCTSFYSRKTRLFCFSNGSLRYRGYEKGYKQASDLTTCKPLSPRWVCIIDLQCGLPGNMIAKDDHIVVFNIHGYIFHRRSTIECL